MQDSRIRVSIRIRHASRAIVSARNKKKGGLDDDTIAGLVDQVVGGGGYTGTLDSSNSTLIAALQTYREKLVPYQALPLEADAHRVSDLMLSRMSAVRPQQ